MLVDFQSLVSIVEGIDIELLSEKIYLEKGEVSYNENELLDIEINKIITERYGISMDLYKEIINKSIVQIQKGGLIYQINGNKYTVKTPTNSEKKQLQKMIFS